MHPFNAFCCYAGFGTIVALVSFLFMSPGSVHFPSEASVAGVFGKMTAGSHAGNSAEDVSVPTIVKFGAPWCGPCREVDVELQKLERSFAEKVQIIQINVDQRPDLVKKCRVERIPHLFLYVNDKAVKEFQGFLTESELVAWAGLK
jgi:thioredoxin 1